VVMVGSESKGVEGTLEAGQTQAVSIMFCPSKSWMMTMIMLMIMLMMIVVDDDDNS